MYLLCVSLFLKCVKLTYIFPSYSVHTWCYILKFGNLFAAKNTWSQPVIKGTTPAPRDSHSCTTIGDNLYVFGGTDGFNPLQDLHILDTCEYILPL